MESFTMQHIALAITSFVAILCSLLAMRMSYSANQRTEYLMNKVDFMKDRIDNQQPRTETVYMGMYEQMNRIEMMIGRLEGITKEK